MKIDFQSASLFRTPHPQLPPGLAFLFASSCGPTPTPPLSVFNAGCRALLGTINAEQFEREIMRQNPAAPDHHDNGNGNDQEDDFVWVEPPGMRDAAVAAAAGNDNDNDHGEIDSDGNDDNWSGDEDEGGGGGEQGNGVAGGNGAGREGVGRPGGRKVSGKRARRGFEERKERREERRLALQALGQDEWD